MFAKKRWATRGSQGGFRETRRRAENPNPCEGIFNHAYHTAVFDLLIGQESVEIVDRRKGRPGLTKTGDQLRGGAFAKFFDQYFREGIDILKTLDHANEAWIVLQIIASEEVA